ncbi:hypothetical protein EW146_g1465 [Bondarzewia mesenterica]|uniref:AMP-dependent synthetase/ligase domain-containing protein n=1 Tax=Bondarzewia mesenterica TaxID=1095465 RepID=A0A4S4M591_9AGAM|nr:hypothetical protein EW146_g1465 [Bondarzewia mesenterica]
MRSTLEQMSWTPKRSLGEVNQILCAPGQLHEVETRLVDGRVQRVYKNLWPSLRHFWLWATQEYRDKTYIVFENYRIPYGEALERSAKAAAVFRYVYGVNKGDRVVICSRNFPDYLIAFWACHLLGAISVLVNAWLPAEPTKHCFVGAGCKLAIVDPQRADLIENLTGTITKEAGTAGFLVIEHHEGKGKWQGMQNWSEVLDSYRGDCRSVLDEDPDLLPEDNATIIFTSGTTGLPKGVLGTHRMFLTNVANVLVGSRRAILRRGEPLPPFVVPEGPQKGILISVPLFHVTGSTSLSVQGTCGFDVFQHVQSDMSLRLIRNEKISIAGGLPSRSVPSMVADLSDSSAVGCPLESLLFGGAAAPEQLARRAHKAFPTASMSQGYGLTETNSMSVGFAGEDYYARPTSVGLAMPVNDILIVKDDKVVPVGESGEIWLRGPNVMKGYWGDPRELPKLYDRTECSVDVLSGATAAAITIDGWLKSGDIGYLDHEGFLYIRDRIKDLILRGGENIDSLSVENAVSADERLLEVAAVGVPDARYGEQVAVVASVKPVYKGKVTEKEVINIARERLPRFSVPVMVILQDERLPLNPSGKILKRELREIAKTEWARRSRNMGDKGHEKAKL